MLPQLRNTKFAFWLQQEIQVGGFKYLIFFIFSTVWGNDEIWLIFFKWVETTNNRYSKSNSKNLYVFVSIWTAFVWCSLQEIVVKLSQCPQWPCRCIFSNRSRSKVVAMRSCHNWRIWWHPCYPKNEASWCNGPAEDFKIVTTLLMVWWGWVYVYTTLMLLYFNDFLCDTYLWYT